MIRNIKKFVAWLKKNERHLWSVMFVSGFAFDVAAFLPAPLSRANFLFAIYLTLVLVGTIGGHYFHTHGYDRRKGILPRALSVLFPFIGDFFIGGLLSGLLIFYTKNSAVLVSWPFILLLAVIFFSNELFRDYRKHLAFQLTLVFFTMYGFAIFALPLAIGTVSSKIFLESGALSVGAYIVLLVLLGVAGWKRLKEAFLWITIAGVALVALINAAYFSGIIPPLPLTLTDVGVYQSVTRTDDSYVLVGEPAKPWWDTLLKPQVVEVTPGSSLSVFGSVFAPVAFSSTIVHYWEVYDTIKHAWVMRAEIAFLMTGGRDGGYRGYSTITDIQPGLYRVSIETLSGQVIGRTEFQVDYVNQQPPLVSESK